MSVPPPIGVLALQGDVREHLQALSRQGADAFGVRRVEELDRCAGIVLPGGESTTIIRLARTFGLLEPLRERIREGLPVFGTCAGMILLADNLVGSDAGQETIGGLNISVRRNAFGRQIDSFETHLDFQGLPDPVPAVFIRAPWVESAGDGVDVLARVSSGPAAGKIVAVRQGSMLATSFHPEVDGDGRVHGLFLDLLA